MPSPRTSLTPSFCALPVRAMASAVGLALAALLGTAQASTTEGPITLYADQIHGAAGKDWTATGDVKVLYGVHRLYADQAHYDPQDDEIRAKGHVRMVSPGLITSAPEASVKVHAHQGVVLHPRYVMPAQHGHGHAQSGRELGQGRYQLNEACYTTCHGQVPAWRVDASRLYLNQNDEYITTWNSTLDVHGVPVLWLPYLSFPLKRHSGFLTPTVGSSTINGFNLGIPYYFDIAPNMDDTLTVSGFTKRGVMLQNQFRYLEPQLSGQAYLDFLPHDKLTGKNIWAISWQNQMALGDGVNLGINVNRVSYRNFLADFAGSAGFTGGYVGGIGNAPYLTSSAQLTWGNQHWDLGALLQGYQELALGGTAPYAQLPEVYANSYWRLGNTGYFQWRSNFNYFYTSSGPIGQRLDLTPTVGWKFSRAWGFLDPQARLYYSHYQIQRNTPDYARDINRSLPALSLQGGVNFVRYGHGGSYTLVQPIFKYLYIPLQAQNDIPLFDTSQPYLNYPAIFTDNVLYDGSDRINAANQLAWGLEGTGYNTRGRQVWQAAIGQIDYFNRRQINLAGDIVPQAARSNYFWQAQYAPARNWQFVMSSETNSNWQRFERLDFRSQWLGQDGRVLNLDYRYTRNFVNQVGVSGALPVFHNWRVLGSYQYDVDSDQPLEQLLGIGYDGGCWAAQLMVYHQILLGGQSNNAVYLEIVLRGLTSVGNSSNGFLNQYVPGASMEF